MSLAQYIHVKSCCFSLITAIAVFGANFGQGIGPIFLDNVGCNGTESTLLSCSHRITSLHYCSHLEDAGVVCPPCESACIW